MLINVKVSTVETHILVINCNSFANTFVKLWFFDTNVFCECEILLFLCYLAKILHFCKSVLKCDKIQLL